MSRASWMTRARATGGDEDAPRSDAARVIARGDAFGCKSRTLGSARLVAVARVSSSQSCAIDK